MHRRGFVVGVASVGAAAGLSGLAISRARAASPTPAVGAGPFFPVTLPSDMDSDLVRVQGLDAQALGVVAHLSGAVTDARGAPIEGAMVEIWQADASGRYNHPRQEFVSRRDPHFQGYGRVTTGRGGAYRFRTLRPTPYEVALGAGPRFLRAAHIHMRVQAPGRPALTTQVFRTGDPLLATDFELASVPVTERPRVIVDFTAAADLEADAVKARFDVIVA